MPSKKGIIVCSNSESRTSKKIVDIIEQLCPGEKVTFQSTKTTRFDSRKVVFCHSSSDGRLALTDVNDCIYEKSIIEARRKLGKGNVSFIVTDVRAAEATTKRRMIEQSQPTLISNISMLLLVDSVDVKENLNQLREFFGNHPLRTIPGKNNDNNDNNDNDNNNNNNNNNTLFICFLFLFALMLIICLAWSFNLTKHTHRLESRINEQANTPSCLESYIIEQKNTLRRLESCINEQNNTLSLLGNQMTELEKRQINQTKLFETLNEHATKLEMLNETINTESRLATARAVNGMVKIEGQHRTEIRSLRNLRSQQHNMETQLVVIREGQNNLQIQVNKTRLIIKEMFNITIDNNQESLNRMKALADVL